MKKTHNNNLQVFQEGKKIRSKTSTVEQQLKWKKSGHGEVDLFENRLDLLNEFIAYVYHE